MESYRSTQRRKMVNLVGEGLTRKHYEFLPERAERLSGVQAYEDKPPRDAHSPQAVGDRSNLQGPDVDNDTRNWADERGPGAEGKPAFDRMQSRKPQPNSPAESGRRRKAAIIMPD